MPADAPQSVPKAAPAASEAEVAEAIRLAKEAAKATPHVNTVEDAISRLMTEQELLAASQDHEGKQKYMHPVNIMQLRERGWYKPDHPHLQTGPHLGATSDPISYDLWREAAKRALQFRAMQLANRAAGSTDPRLNGGDATALVGTVPPPMPTGIVGTPAPASPPAANAAKSKSVGSAGPYSPIKGTGKTSPKGKDDKGGKGKAPKSPPAAANGGL